jgi:hypothetical protein
MATEWPSQVTWPSLIFLEELKAKAHDYTIEILASPSSELDITESSLQGYQLQDLVVEFSHLSVVLQTDRRTHYYRITHNIGPPSQGSPILPLFWYEVEFSPEGELWDDFFDHY